MWIEWASLEAMSDKKPDRAVDAPRSTAAVSTAVGGDLFNHTSVLPTCIISVENVDRTVLVDTGATVSLVCMYVCCKNVGCVY